MAAARPLSDRRGHKAPRRATPAPFPRRASNKTMLAPPPSPRQWRARMSRKVQSDRPRDAGSLGRTVATEPGARRPPDAGNLSAEPRVRSALPFRQQGAMRRQRSSSRNASQSVPVYACRPPWPHWPRTSSEVLVPRHRNHGPGHMVRRARPCRQAHDDRHRPHRACPAGTRRKPLVSPRGKPRHVEVTAAGSRMANQRLRTDQ